MPKFKVEVTKIYCVEHIVEADDIDHANEIGSEISDEMKTNLETFIESDWKAKQVEDDAKITYAPVQEYLK